jgi:uncharacterized protein (TIGR02246 family)
VDAEAAARAWVEGWSRAWPAGDAELVATLYTEDASFNEHPFREPRKGAAGAREYAEWTFGAQADAECRFGEPIVSGDRAAVDWWAIVTDTDGDAETLVGASILRFAADGRVVEQRDVWAAEPGRRELPTWA